MINRLPVVLVVLIVIMIPLGTIMKHASALERTINIEGVNYVSLTQMAKKYNLAILDSEDQVRLNGEGVNLVVNKTSNLFVINDQTHTGQTPPKYREGETWISAKDWATMFNLALTNYDKVSQMEPAKGKPVSTEAILDPNTYEVGESWGESVPEAVRKHGNITNIETPHTEQPVYETTRSNPIKEDFIQGRQ